MSEKTKRKLWQFHLSTLLILTLVVAGILWLQFASYFNARQKNGDFAAYYVSYGWPMVASKFEGESIIGGISFARRWQYLGLAVDGIVSIGMLIFTIVISEWLVRRREARKA